jgi:LysR family glycine cleavage system transcriptional activator
MAKRLPPLSALRPFEAAARLESFTRAAEELSLTHGAVSHQVRALEDHLGTPLFSRQGKRVTLTPAGRTFAEAVRNALQQITRAADAAGSKRRDNRLSVSVLPSFAARWLMPRMIRFMDAHPDIEINVDATTALANFAAEEVDVAIRFGRGPWAGLACEEFLRDEYFPVASPKLAKLKSLKAPQDLLKMRVIREDRDYWQHWFAAAGVPVEGELDGSPFFNDSTLTLQSAARGEGVALARSSIVGEDLERGTLKRLFDVSVASRESYWFVSPRESAEAPKVRAFREWVKKELKK